MGTGVGMGQGSGAVDMLLSGREFSSFGLCEGWLGDLDSCSSLRTSGISQPVFDIEQSPGFAVNSGRQKSPVL